MDKGVRASFTAGLEEDASERAGLGSGFAAGAFAFVCGFPKNDMRLFCFIFPVSLVSEDDIVIREAVKDRKMQENLCQGQKR